MLDQHIYTTRLLGLKNTQQQASLGLNPPHNIYGNSEKFSKKLKPAVLQPWFNQSQLVYVRGKMLCIT